MKRWIAALAALMMLCLTGCVEPDAPTDPTDPPPLELDVQALYEDFLELDGMPDMMPLDAAMMLNYCGIRAEDCVSAVVAICGDGLRTDEVWIIEAVDADAAGRLLDLADSRLQAKAAESQSYSPEQYAVVQAAEVMYQDNYVFVLVSPMVDDMVQLVQNATTGG